MSYNRNAETSLKLFYNVYKYLLQHFHQLYSKKELIRITFKKSSITKKKKAQLYC